MHLPDLILRSESYSSSQGATQNMPDKAQLGSAFTSLAGSKLNKGEDVGLQPAMHDR